MTTDPSPLAMLSQLSANTVSHLPASDGHPASWHLWHQREIHALTIALAAQRPLLVRGEPGTGKSQLARAAAAALGWKLHSTTLHARSEAQDLLYQFDAVLRLADAQANKAITDEAKYWQPQALWRALDWPSSCAYGSLRHAPPENPLGHVVLIDEIDKAPSDVPNGLLDVLGARFFEIPALGKRIPAQGSSTVWPLVIITTNEERELPPAFLRRCMVLAHDVKQGAEYLDFLLQHGAAHFGAGREGEHAVIAPEIRQEAAKQLLRDRENAQAAQLTAPGLAEYIDLLSALHQIAPNDSAKQGEWLGKLSQYAFLKNRIEAGGDDQLRQGEQ